MRSKYLKDPSDATNNNANPSPRSPTQGERSTDLYIYTIRDTVTDSIIGGLQLHKNEQSAIRTAQHIIKQPGSVVGMNPSDFELLCLGTIDQLNWITPMAEVVLSREQMNTLAGNLNAQKD